MCSTGSFSQRETPSWIKIKPFFILLRLKKGRIPSLGKQQMLFVSFFFLRQSIDNSSCFNKSLLFQSILSLSDCKLVLPFSGNKSLLLSLSDSYQWNGIFRMAPIRGTQSHFKDSGYQIEFPAGFCQCQQPFYVRNSLIQEGYCYNGSHQSSRGILAFQSSYYIFT